MLESGINLVDMESGDIVNLPRSRSLPRIMTSNPDAKDKGNNSTESEDPKKIVIVSNFLPLHAQKDTKSGKWSISFDDDSLLFQVKDSLSTNAEVVYVGSLKVEIDANVQEEVAKKLLDEFNCVPTFLTSELHQMFYHRFCKHYLWPLFHYALPISRDHCDCFDRSLWRAYVTANQRFANKVLEVVNPEIDFVWIHDYHLMLVPTFLRKHFTQVQLGFFLHSPFPLFEIYSTLPVRDQILRALLHTDLIGFHTFNYARNFLSCCSRMLGLSYENNWGRIRIEFLGRTTYVKILPVGIHLGRVESILNHPATAIKVKEIQQKFKDETVIVGVDDMDIFKGINLKLLAMEKLLHQHPALRGEVVLVQIINPARSSGKQEEEAKLQMNHISKRINDVFGSPGYEPVVLIDHPISVHEIAAYYALAECCIVNAVRDGMNLIPYTYVVCRQGTPKLDEVLRIPSGSPHTSTLVISEFVGCSPSLSGAIRVNPWDVECVANAITEATKMDHMQKNLRHDKHYRYVSSHDIAYWAQSFLLDLEYACKDHYTNRRWVLGFGLDYRILSLPPNFRKLTLDDIVSAYQRSRRRAIFLDYDGTLVPQTSLASSPCDEVITALNNLCSDPGNTVFVVSGRGKDSLGLWFGECKNLGIAAEHGYFTRWNAASVWKSVSFATNFDWKEVAEHMMKFYTDATDGSYIETKETALVWHYRDADADFGSSQGKELLDHLEHILANEPVVVKRGQHIVEVKPQGITKGLVLEKVLSNLSLNKEPAEFVLCIGDDRSDEDMFEAISVSTYTKPPSTTEIFACTVGQKPSKARYFLDNSFEVGYLIQALASIPKTTSDDETHTPPPPAL